MVGWTVTLLAVAAASAWFAYGYGVSLAGGQRLARGQLLQRELEQALVQMRQENDELLARVAELEYLRKSDGETARRLGEQIALLQEEKRRQAEDLAFYKSIVSPQDGDNAFQIHNLKLQPQALPRRFRYELILTQALEQDRYVSGVAGFRVHGRNGEGVRDLSLGEISSGTERQHYFRFRYFQTLAGHIELPDGFLPQRVDVEAVVEGKKEQTFTRSFVWPAKLLPDGGATSS